MSDIDTVLEILNRLDHAINGNGRPGLLDRMTVIEIQQRDCPARLAASITARQTKIAFSAVVVSVLSLVVSVVLVIWK